MSAMNFTGVYFALSPGSPTSTWTPPPACSPATIAHELAHQRGIASEQECNFLAVLASTTCGDPVYEYSGWLMGYIHLGNALYQADPASLAGHPGQPAGHGAGGSGILTTPTGHPFEGAAADAEPEGLRHDS